MNLLSRLRPDLPKLSEQATHDPAVDVHQLARLFQVVICGFLHPPRLHREDFGKVLALRHPAQCLAILGNTV